MTGVLNLIAKDLVGYLEKLRMRASLQTRGVFLSPTAVITGKKEAFHTGKNCTIGAHSIIDINDDPMRARSDSHLTLGDYVYIGDNCNIRTAGAGIQIGSNTMVANGVIIVGSNHGTTIGTPMRLQPWDMEGSGVTIGQDCWIAAGAIVLPGTTVGDGAIVAAGAVARGNIMAGSIVAGVPARLVRMRA
ncbi:MAG: acyltransferase [Luteolibacter sp.]